MTHYITPQGADKVREFKYKGGSISISYQHLWSPLAEKVVSYVPKTVAPNLITVIGTIIHIIGNMSLIVQGKGNNLWPLSLLFFGFCVFAYYTLDNVDGKQARRTKSSSPLGMCMDHGCDVLGVSFIALGVGQLIGATSSTTLLFSSQVAVLGTFWASVWSQYHSKGVLVLGKFISNLGKINAVDDGIPFVAFLGFFTFFVGQ
jgi:ethanolaminephosphotransferase